MQAGEIVAQSVELICQECRFVVLVGRGARIPPCPCGASNYEESSLGVPVSRPRRIRRKRPAPQDSAERAA